MWLIVISLLILVLIYVRRVRRLLLAFPAGQRRQHLGRVMALAAGSLRPGRVPVDAEHAHLDPVNEDVPAVYWHTFVAAPGLISDARQVTREGNFADVRALDVDGTALVIQVGANSTGYRLVMHRRDGRHDVIASGGVHDTGEILSGSIDHGAVAWLRDDAARRVLEVWRWDEDGGSRVLHEFAYSLPKSAGVTNGAVLIAGDVTVATFLPGGVGVIVAHRAGEPVAHLAATSFITLHRDLVAESRGLRRAAVTTHLTGVPTGVVSELDLDVWPPRLTPIMKGPWPGASTQMGKLLGFWRGTHGLEIPGHEAILFGDGFVGDPVGDGAYVGFIRTQSFPGREVSLGQAAYVVDPARRRNVALTESAVGCVIMRGAYVSWSEARPRPVTDTTYTGVSSWVAQLADTAEGPR